MGKTLNIVFIIALSISPFVNDLTTQTYENKSKKETDNKKKDLTKYKRYSFIIGTIICVAGGLMYWKFRPATPNDNLLEASNQQTTTLEEPYNVSALHPDQQTNCPLSNLHISTHQKHSNSQTVISDQQIDPISASPQKIIFVEDVKESIKEIKAHTIWLGVCEHIRILLAKFQALRETPEEAVIRKELELFLENANLQNTPLEDLIKMFKLQADEEEQANIRYEELTKLLQETNQDDLLHAIKKWEESDIIEPLLQPFISHFFHEPSFQVLSQQCSIFLAELQRGNFPRIITENDSPTLPIREINNQKMIDGNVSLKQMVIHALVTQVKCPRTP